MYEAIFKTFYFEIIIDPQEVAKKVERSWYTLLPDSPSGTILGNYSIILKPAN